MTDSEVVREIRKLADRLGYKFGVDYKGLFTTIADHMEKQCEENDKLKEEIKQLKATISKMETTTKEVNNV